MPSLVVAQVHVQAASAMAKVTLFFKAINKDEHLASLFLARERGHVPAKWPVGWPRKRKLLAEVPPDIDRASKIVPSLSDDVGQEAKRIRCQYTTKQKMHVVMYARHHGVRPASRKFSIPRKNIQRWLKDSDLEEVTETERPSKGTH